MNTNPLFRLVVDLSTGTKLPEQARALCEAIVAFVEVSARFAAGKATFWEWRRELERVQVEMRKL
jgi:hypothetical protein